MTISIPYLPLIDTSIGPLKNTIARDGIIEEVSLIHESIIPGIFAFTMKKAIMDHALISISIG